MEKLGRVNRIEVIDHSLYAVMREESGRVFAMRQKGRVDAYFDLQDAGRTLKIFLADDGYLPDAALDKYKLRRMFDDLQVLRKHPGLTQQDRVDILAMELILQRIAQPLVAP